MQTFARWGFYEKEVLVWYGTDLDWNCSWNFACSNSDCKGYKDQSP